MSLDTARPHAQVYGLPGVYWQQDGQYYRKNGALVADPDAPQSAAPDPEPVKAAAKRKPSDGLSDAMRQIYHGDAP